MRPLKAFGSPLLDLCASTRFVDHQAMFDASFPEAGGTTSDPAMSRP